MNLPIVHLDYLIMNKSVSIEILIIATCGRSCARAGCVIVFVTHPLASEGAFLPTPRPQAHHLNCVCRRKTPYDQGLPNDTRNSSLFLWRVFLDTPTPGPPSAASASESHPPRPRHAGPRRGSTRSASRSAARSDPRPSSASGPLSCRPCSGRTLPDRSACPRPS